MKYFIITRLSTINGKVFQGGPRNELYTQAEEAYAVMREEAEAWFHAFATPSAILHSTFNGYNFTYQLKDLTPHGYSTHGEHWILSEVTPETLNTIA